MKNNKGITIVALSITIIVLLILSSIVISKINKNNNIEKYNKMTADIQMLEDKIAVYYSKYEEIPIKASEILKDDVEKIPEEQKNDNDSNNYYEIDVNKLENITLNNGKETDKYIINEETHTVYYLEGVEVDGVNYYRYTDKFTYMKQIELDIEYTTETIFVEDGIQVEGEFQKYKPKEGIEILLERYGYELINVETDELTEEFKDMLVFDNIDKKTTINPIEREQIERLKEQINEDTIKLYCEWQIEQHSIQFNSMGGTNVNTITQDYYTQVTEPSNPTKEDYVFAGWYENEEYTGEEYSFTTMPGENITLYAKWIEVVAKIGEVGYTSIQDAINASQNGETIKIIKNTSGTITNNKDITIDLNGKTVEGSITNTGALAIIDTSTSGIGKIINSEGITIKNEEGATIQIGVNDGALNKTKPEIEGTTYGIENSGTLKFYDGRIIGTTGATNIGDLETIEKPNNIDIITSQIENKNILSLGIGASAIAQIGEEKYISLENAINVCSLEAGENITEIILLKDTIETVTIKAGQNIRLNLNNYTITGQIINKGTLEVTDTSIEKAGAITSANRTILNEGTFTLNKGTIEVINTESSSSATLSIYSIYNNGDVIINDGNITGIKGGRNCSVTGIYNDTGKVIINGGIIDINISDSAYGYGVYNYPSANSISEVTINDGTIKCETEGYNTAYGIYNTSSNYATANILINGGEITSKSTADNDCIIYNNSTAIKSTANITMNDGVLKIENFYKNNNSSYSTCGISNSCSTDNSANITIKGGTITAERKNYGNVCGIYSSGLGCITIGENNDLVKNDAPTIEGKTCGIFNGNVLNYYDGTIIGTKAIIGSVNNVPDGYEIQKTINEETKKEVTSLEEVAEPVAKITLGQTVEEYNSLQEAINSCSIEAEETVTIIEIQKNSINSGTISQGQNIKIDLRGFTIEGQIENNGILQITDSSEQKTGSIISGKKTINNNGTLNINEATIIAENNMYDYSATTYAICNNNNGEVIVNEGIIQSKGYRNYGIYNYSSSSKVKNKITIIGGEIEGQSKSTNNGYGMYNEARYGNIEVTISDANITSNSYGIYNSSTYGSIKMTINGGEIKANYYGIYSRKTDLEINRNCKIISNYIGINNLEEKLLINEGIIEVTGYNSGIRRYGIYNTGSVTIIKGKINVDYSNNYYEKYGIYSTGGTVIVGEKDNVVNNESQNNLEIFGKTNGVYSTGTFNYYDGIIMGTMSIKGAINDVPEGYEVQKIVSEETEIETAQLVKTTTVATINSEGIITEYNSLQSAINSCNIGETTPTTIQMQRDVLNSGVTSVGHNIIINLNGKVIEGQIENNGILEIIDTSSSTQGEIKNSDKAIINNGTFTLTSGIITATDLSNGKAIYNNKSQSNIIIKGGTVIAYNCGIYNYSAGNIVIENGMIKVENPNQGGKYGILNNSSSGSVTINGGKVKVKTYGNSYGIWNPGSTNVITMNSGEINIEGTVGSNYGIIRGIIIINDGTINATNLDNSNSGGAICEATEITIGKDDNSINIEKPIISGTNYGIYDCNKINYFDGTTLGKTSITGFINNVPVGYEVRKTINEESGIETAQLIESTTVATINSEGMIIEYNSLQKAIDDCSIEAGETITRIKMQRDVINNGIISDGQNIQIDLNGKVIEGQIENNGTLEITDNSEEKNGKIKSSDKTINNNGKLTVDNGYISAAGAGNNKGYAIYNKNSGNVIINDGNITSTYCGIYNYVYDDVTNKNNVIINGGTITTENTGYATKAIENYASISSNNLNNVVANVTINGGTIISNMGGSGWVCGAILNTSYSSNYNKKKAILNVTINDGVIKSNYCGISNSISGSSEVNILLNKGQIEIDSKFTNSYGIYVSSNNNCNIIIHEANIIANSSSQYNYGIYFYAPNSVLTMDKGSIMTTNTYKTGSAYGIYSTGHINIGNNDGVVDTIKPEIIGMNCGIDNTEHTLNYYDGKISGVTAIMGEILDKPIGYKVYTTVVNNKQVVTLIPSAGDAAVALVNGVYYTKLQLAINAVGTTQSTIQLISDVQLEEDIVIAEGQNIIIDLNGNQIKEKIINNGTLTIIDSSGNGKIKNETGTAIINNSTGVLTIGESSGIISTSVPEIAGTTYGIENNGTLNFYDGKIMGQTAISGEGTINTQSGYTISTITENNVQTSILVIQ